MRSIPYAGAGAGPKPQIDDKMQNPQQLGYSHHLGNFVCWKGKHSLLEDKTESIRWKKVSEVLHPKTNLKKSGRELKLGLLATHSLEWTFILCMGFSYIMPV